MSNNRSDDSMTVEIVPDLCCDGIQQYDNPIPSWWSFVFFITIVFAFLYFAFFHFGAEGRSIQDEYERRLAKTYEARFQEIGKLQPNRATIYHYMNDSEWLTVGRAIYKTNCVNCHLADGSGALGPNLTDNYWKNVRNIEDIAKVINDGSAKGTMPAWRKRMAHPNQIVLVAAYVASLRKNHVLGKAPEGDLIPAWSAE